jgi:hypothetical protein
MNHEAVRDSWNAYWVYYRLRVHKVSEQGFLVAGTTERETLLLVYEISRVENAEKCLNPFRRVKFSWRVVPHNEVPEKTSPNWTGINWNALWDLPSGVVAN